MMFYSKSVVTNGSYAELTHMYALSAAVGHPIMSYCPASEEDSDHHLYAQLIYGRSVSVTSSPLSSIPVVFVLLKRNKGLLVTHIVQSTNNNEMADESKSETTGALFDSNQPFFIRSSPGNPESCKDLEHPGQNIDANNLICSETADCSDSRYEQDCDEQCVSESNRPFHSSSNKYKSVNKKHDWLHKRDGGYFCTLCIEYGVISKQGGGAWVTVPVLVKQDKVIYKKPAKHAESSTHKMALIRHSSLTQGCTSVVDQVHEKANRKSIGNDACMKLVFWTAYFLFTSAVAHTTNWRPLLSTVAACDPTKSLQAFFESSPANAHHLSSTTVTDVLDAFGEAIAAHVKQRCAIGAMNEFSVMADECTNCNAQEMTSVCIHIIVERQVEEVFLGCWSIPCTKAVAIHKCIMDALNQYNLNPANLVAASFDGASNMSGQHAGVQALLRDKVPHLIFVHCRSHMLQLAMIDAANGISNIKRVIATINKLYSFFQHSPLRFDVLMTVQMAIDGESHKVVQACDTRWLSNARRVHVIVEHYAAILVALESIYVDAGNMSPDAGGLLLTLRKPSTLFLLTLLNDVLKPLAKLSKCLQTASGNMSQAMATVKAVTENLSATNISQILTVAEETKQKVQTAGAKFDTSDDIDMAEQKRIETKYVETIVKNLKVRFLDSVSQLYKMYDILQARNENEDFSELATVLKFHAVSFPRNGISSDEFLVT